MPKRKNPFGDTASIQLKTHVGFNQVATEADKQAVFDKTKALLLHGANPHLTYIPTGTDVENVPPTNITDLPKRLFNDVHYGTNLMTVSNGTHLDGSNPNGLYCATSNEAHPRTCRGGLLKYFSSGTNGQVVDVKRVSEQSAVVVCGCCHREDVELVMECAHCGRRVCGVEGCLRECQVCKQTLCQFCTVLNYTEREVRTFCFDCLPMLT